MLRQRTNRLEVIVRPQLCQKHLPRTDRQHISAAKSQLCPLGWYRLAKDRFKEGHLLFLFIPCATKTRFYCVALTSLEFTV